MKRLETIDGATLMSHPASSMRGVIDYVEQEKKMRLGRRMAGHR